MHNKHQKRNRKSGYPYNTKQQNNTDKRKNENSPWIS